MHGEAKQTKMLAFGGKKSLLQGQARRTGGLGSKSQNFLLVWGEKFFIGKIWGEGYRV